jgi:exosortase A-associated hydrolase 2
MIETPLFFGDDAEPLFGVVHQPDVATGSPFVFCHPFGEEKLWAHRVFVSYARLLASAGHPVLRFDYRGNGDSSGEFSDSSLAGAIADVRSAIAEVRRQCQADSVHLLGLRLGATIAALVAAQERDVDRLVMWAPIVDGGAYMQELLRGNVTTQMAVYKEIRQDREGLVAAMRSGETVNVDGYELSYALYSEVTAVKLAAEQSTHRGPTLVVRIERNTQRPAPDLDQLVTRFDQGTLVAAQEEPFWKEIARSYQLPAANVFAVTQGWMHPSRENATQGQS